MTFFFSHRPHISNFPPVSLKLLFPPTLKNSPLCFIKIHLLFTYFMCISFPPTLTMMHLGLCITKCTYVVHVYILDASERGHALDVFKILSKN